jgi:hypothetical protein
VAALLLLLMVAAPLAPAEQQRHSDSSGVDAAAAWRRGGGGSVEKETFAAINEHMTSSLAGKMMERGGKLSRDLSLCLVCAFTNIACVPTQNFH